MNITVLGAGAFGTALGRILEIKGHHVTYYSLGLPITLEQALQGADYMLLSIPSKALNSLVPKLPTNIPLIVATKGILDLSIFQNFTTILALSGPGFATDINNNKPTHLTASNPKIIELFTTDWLTFDLTDDIFGIFLCGALKNVYAINAGLQNFKAGTDKHENYLEAVTNEMKTILDANQANPATVDLSCGIGDLRITCNYPSRNFEFGQKLRENRDYKPEKTVEGVTALQNIKRGMITIPESAIIMQKLIKESDKWA